MKALSLLASACLVVALATAGTTARAAASGSKPFKHVIVFGDSLTDQGNTEAAYSFPPEPLYSQGRYSDNLNWVDILGQQLSVKIKNSVAQGTNYAYAFATTSVQDPPPPLPFTTQTIDFQESLYLSSVHGKADPKALYIIEAGATDILGLLYQVQTDPLLILFIPTLDLQGTQNLTNETQALLKAGAEHVLVSNVPNLGLLPYITEQSGLGGILAPGVATNAAQIWDSDLAQDMVPLTRSGKVILWDFYNTSALALKSASKFGITNTTTECVLGYGLDKNAKDKCSPSEEPKHAFFDQVHFTTGGYFGMEQGAFCALGFTTEFGWSQKQCIVTQQSMDSYRDGRPILRGQIRR